MNHFKLVAISLLLSFSVSTALAEEIWLGEDINLLNSPSYNYEVETICSSLSSLAKDAKFQRPQGNWRADFIAVDKARKLLHLMSDGKLFRSYNVALGRQPRGKKLEEGDNKTPEGLYLIDYRNSGSNYHRSLHISYPNQDDINQARRRGVSPGGDIFIHGLPNEAWKRAFINHPKQNWTRGCVAVTNEEVEEIWGYVFKNTPIELCP